MPWYTGAHREAVEASIKKYSPRPEKDEVPLAAAAAATPWVTGQKKQWRAIANRYTTASPSRANGSSSMSCGLAISR
ncbi:hypothetical protein [Arthrobacter sp. 2MCAF15]|uniref:hypothetical protein n=1 Tax=Arthrobacter sp. 2MCAF15 TaxID=3232984 RepID=UPI003F9258AC